MLCIQFNSFSNTTCWYFYRRKSEKYIKKKWQIGYVIRDETVLTGQNYKNGLVEIKTEGEKVAKNDNVFRYYSNNESSLSSKIAELDSQIQEAMEGQKLGYPADIQLLDKQIEEYISKTELTNNVRQIAEYKEMMADLLIKKAKIAGELSPAGSYISSLIEKRRGYEEELNDGQEYIKAATSGVVSYKIDGLEQILTPNNFDNISEKLLDDYNLKTGQMVANSKEQGKIVNNYEGYIVVFLNSKEAKNAKVNDTVTLRMSDATEVNAKIAYIREDNGKNMIIFQIDKYIEELIAYRKISLEVIWWSEQGLKIPNVAISEENGIKYVTRNRAGYTDKIYIKIKMQNDNYAIIENYTTSELLELGYTQSEIASMKSISLYDEVAITKEK